MGESFESWECRLDSCSVALNAVTKNTYLLIVASDPRVGKFEEIPLMASPDTARTCNAGLQH